MTIDRWTEEDSAVPEPKLRAVVPSIWGEFYEQTGIPAATSTGDSLHVTGHTGTLEDGTFPAGAEAQIRQTFLNLTDTLSAAGATWADVVSINSYQVGLRAQGDLLLIVAAEFMETPFPAWTAVGVTELYEDEAVVEISCIAAIGRDRG
jgi:enamine deaminase RidA (YjgF/YER057c/UK114 family)